LLKANIFITLFQISAIGQRGMRGGLGHPSFCQGLQRLLDRFPLPLGLVRGLGCGFGRGLVHRALVRGFVHRTRVHRPGQMHRACTHLAAEQGLLGLRDFLLCRDLARAI
jgi:hypothetical protein